MPTLGTLTTSVFRDLADDAKAVFTTTQVEDFIRSGVVEINRVAPVDKFVTIILVDGQFGYSVALREVNRVQVLDSEFHDVATVPLADGSISGDSGADLMGQYGWRFRRVGDAGSIELPMSLVDKYMEHFDDNTRPIVKVWGYGSRTIPTNPATETGLSAEEEYAVREWAKTEGFTLLTHDRSLFAQWQGQTNNTDVSPVMMMNMAGQAKAEWSRRRGLIRVIRRMG